MAGEKPGCSVHIDAYMTDENGQKISVTDSSWHGFSRDHANDAIMQIIGSVMMVVEGWKETAKSERQSKPAK